MAKNARVGALHDRCLAWMEGNVSDSQWLSLPGLKELPAASLTRMLASAARSRCAQPYRPVVTDYVISELQQYRNTGRENMIALYCMHGNYLTNCTECRERVFKLRVDILQAASRAGQ